MVIYILLFVIGLIVGIICTIIFICYRYPKHVGIILTNDSDGLYVELDSSESLKIIQNSKNVIFSVNKINTQK